ncbi:MAG: UvrD-helicase domain-containing protein [Bdellovibrionaceae bacterium]|nr:UvrD-helicase domain-containing protein [Pseudobdellovibrionaceae bacterium]
MSSLLNSKDLEQFYKQLNKNQKKAVENFKGPVLVLAGAGSGKTRVLVYRITALILQGQANLENILAVTFTNKSAKEMKERVTELLSYYSLPYTWTPWIGTFHSICAGILRQNIPLLKDRKTVTIYDQGDQLSLIKKVLKDLRIDPKIKDPKSIRSQINLCKRMAVGPEEVHKISYLYYDRQFESIYLNYERALKNASAFDFESLLLETYKLMLKYPEFLSSLQKKFSYICVDEYQDTNHIQYLLIKKLAEKHQNIMVVGDEDQSIYSWRGADMKNIMDFEKDFKNCKTFFLEENYRSTKNIVLGANALIANNKVRKGKNLRAQKSDGHKIHIRETYTDYEEGQFVSQSIRSFCSNDGDSWQDFAILYRTNAQSRILEDHLRILKIPYKIVGGVRFYERKEIKIALSYLKLILNSEDDVSFLNIINEPRRGVGKVALDKLQQVSLNTKKSFYESLKDSVNQKILKGKTLREVVKFIQCIEELKKQKDSMSLYDLYNLLLNKNGYMESLELQNSIEAQSRIENLHELGNVIEQKEKVLNGGFLNLESFLEEMSLLSEGDKTREGKDFVTLMTLHNSKGLEFHTVFITGLEEGLFPSFQSIEDNNIEEERRLAYVGMTRAKERLILSFTKKRKFWGRDQYNPPSSFLSEIPKELVRQEFISFYKNPEFESDY